MRRVFGSVALVIWSAVGLLAPVSAQTSSSMSMSRPTPPELGFLTSYRFHLNALRLFSSGENFVWDTDVGADLDVFDFRSVRGNVLAAFEGILGEEIRPIDPNQVNYTIDLSVWWRPGEKLGELGATFHHVSRHLSDREKAFAIAWNFLGLQYVHTLEFGFLDLDFGGRGLWKLQRSFVDYAGEIGGYVEVTRPLAGRTSLMFGGEVTAVPVTQRLRNRDALMGSKIEAGVRFHGGRGVGEVFIARERRIDADPLDLNPTTFTMLGFRFLSQ